MFPIDHATTEADPTWPSWSVPAEDQSMLFIEPVHGIAGGMLHGGAAELLAGCGDSRIDASDPASSWLLKTACLEATAWNAAAAQDLCISVELPAASRFKPSMLQAVHQALHQAALAPDLLELRLTEQALRDAGTTGLRTLLGLRDIGVGIAVRIGIVQPDRALGLERLRVTSIVLSSDLVRDLAASRAARAAAAACISFAHRLGARAVAVEVEEALQRDILDDLGCDEGQGPLFGSAMPASLFNASLAMPADI
jgi:EAL domain-containing protein (putative c-di-GMP-specific phosphodiesterase class I)